MKVHISYLSKTGITADFADEINDFLLANDIGSTVQSVYDADPVEIGNSDVVMLGAWCHGLFIMLQHPDKDWVEFARQLPNLSEKRVILFTTYKVATGSMFRKMKKHLKLAESQIIHVFKSKSSRFREEDRIRLLEIIR